MAGQEATAQKNLADAQTALAEAKTDAQRQKYQSEIQAAAGGHHPLARDYYAQVAEDEPGRAALQHPVRPLPHEGLVHARAERRLRADAGAGRLAARSARRCATARPSSQFPGETGRQKQYDWVSVNVEANKGYGVRGISSGRMAHFGNILSKKQIDAIIDFERSL